MAVRFLKGSAGVSVWLLKGKAGGSVWLQTGRVAAFVWLLKDKRNGSLGPRNVLLF